MPTTLIVTDKREIAGHPLSLQTLGAKSYAEGVWRKARMDKLPDLFCNRALRALDEVAEAVMSLHGRGVYRMYVAYGFEIQRDLHDLIREGCMDTNLRPKVAEDAVVLPAFSMQNAKRMRYAWDYFVFLYMSHKIQNIKRRQIASGTLDLPTLLYLRATDYDLAVSEGSAGVGLTSVEDFSFDVRVLTDLAADLNVVKALSPSDLLWAMQIIGIALAQGGNSLGAVAEFARSHEAGVFLNPLSWKRRIAELMPSASGYLVYVSNQSNGLRYELEALAARRAERHTILVLDEQRFQRRQWFFATQERLRESGKELYLEVARDASTVDDPAAFERLVSRFPHSVDLRSDVERLQEEIQALLPIVLRHDADLPGEIPFEFHVNLDPAAAAQVAVLRRHTSDFVEEMLSCRTVCNWPVLLVHLEMDVFLNLAFGNILDAAMSTARYAAIADFVREFIRKESPRPDLDRILEQCGNIGMSIAYDAAAMGEWDDFSDRRERARVLVDTEVARLQEIMSRSVSAARTVLVRDSKKAEASADVSGHVDLLSGVIDQVMDPDET